MKTLQWIAILSTSLFLTACQEQRTPDYLIWHPSEMLDDVRQCQSSRTLPKKRLEYCQMVLKTVSSFMTVVSQQQIDPDAFGLKVLLAQMNAASLKNKMEMARDTLRRLEHEKAPSDMIKKASEDFNKADIAYQNKSREVNVMLAAIGMTSPE